MTFTFRSLDDIARENHEIHEPEIWHYLIDILMAINHLHSFDLLHVDIKPANIFVTSNGICKLGDFGLVFDLNKVVYSVWSIYQFLSS
jgi:membrane-associated tyrosine/threonine-specific cdc2-inhibitory kinase